MTIESLYGLIDEGWATKSQILTYLNSIGCHTDERVLRDFFAKYNQRYEDGEQEFFVAHSSKGYLLTKDKEIIKRSIEDDYKRAMALLRRSYRTKKALANKDHLSLEQSEATLYEIVKSIDKEFYG